MGVFPSNATILFQQPVSDVGIIAHTPAVVSADLLVVASLKEKTRQITGDRTIDTDLYQLPLTGRANNPGALPPSLKPGSRGKCLLWRLQDGFTVPDAFVDYDQFIEANSAYILHQGDFFLRAVVQSRFSVQAILGDQIEGHLTTTVAWDEAI